MSEQPRRPAGAPGSSGGRFDAKARPAPAAELRGVGADQRQHLARERILERVAFIREAIGGMTEEQYVEDGFQAKLVRGATRDAMVNLAHDVEVAGFGDQLPEHQRDGLRATRNHAAHNYVRLDDRLVWVMLNDLGEIEELAADQG